jgi:Predicted integral membrane protein
MRRSHRPLFINAAMLGEPSLPPLRQVTAEGSATWLERGFRDFIAHPGIGLAYGAVFALIGWLVTFGLSQMGMGSMVLPLAGGFMLVAPFLAVGLYEVSRRRENGEGVTLGQALGAFRRNPHMVDMGLVLLLIFFAWFQIAMILFALFFGGQPPALESFFSRIVMAPQGAAFLLTGTAVGGVLAAVAFSLSVVAIPMLLDHQVSALTAMRTSLRAVWLNRYSMVGWAAALVTLVVLGIAFLFVGLAVTLPIAAHASWHAYRDLVGE